MKKLLIFISAILAYGLATFPVCSNPESEISDSSVSLDVKRVFKCIEDDRKNSPKKLFYGESLWTPLSKNVDKEKEIHRHNTLLFNTAWQYKPAECFSNFGLKPKKYKRNIQKSIILSRLLMILSSVKLEPFYFDEENERKLDTVSHFGLGEILGRSGKIILRLGPDLEPDNLFSFLLNGKGSSDLKDSLCVLKKALANYYDIDITKEGEAYVNSPLLDEVLSNLEKTYDKKDLLSSGVVTDVFIPLSYGGIGNFDQHNRMIYFNGKRLQTDKDIQLILNEEDEKKVEGASKEEDIEDEDEQEVNSKRKEKVKKKEDEKVVKETLLTVVDQMQQGALYIDEAKFDDDRGSAVFFTLIPNSFGFKNSDDQATMLQDLYLDSEDEITVARGLSFEKFHTEKRYDGTFVATITKNAFEDLSTTWDKLRPCDPEKKKVFLSFMIDPKIPVIEDVEFLKRFSSMNYPFSGKFGKLIEFFNCTPDQIIENNKKTSFLAKENSSLQANPFNENRKNRNEDKKR